MSIDDITLISGVGERGEGPYRMTMALRCIEVLLHQLHGVTYGDPCPYDDGKGK